MKMGGFFIGAEAGTFRRIVGSEYTMRRPWTLILPVCGLALLLLGVYQGFRLNHRVYGHRPTRYFYWASIRLDSDPLSRYPIPESFVPCKNGEENCVGWDPSYIRVDPGWGARAFMLSALPAFVIGVGIVRTLARFGVSEVTTFFAFMPLLIFAWFYLIGWLFDRRRYKQPVTHR
jgi:hypothetical protein